MGWIRRLFRKSRAERELDRELQFHLDQQIADNLAAGMNPREARRQALLTFGGLERVKQEVRDAHWESQFESLVLDFRYALRYLRHDSRTALVAIFALALGIAASTVVFSVVYNSFFEALPYKNFRQLLVFRLHNLGNTGDSRDRNYFSTAELRTFQQQNRVLEDTIASGRIRLVYDDGVTARYWPLGALVSPNTFDVLGVAPLLGRGISLDDGKLDATPVFVMSYRFWQSEFAGDPKILGRTFKLNDTPTTLVGIMPPHFNLYESVFWMPMRLEQMRGGTFLGRLKNGIGIQAAVADLDAIAHGLHKSSLPGQFPNQTFPEEKFTIVAQTLLDSLIGDFKTVLYLLLAAVLLLMLVGCSNVANLLLVRATVRERELAMRATLGATRVRLVRQLLVECFVLAAAASLAGLALAYFALRLFVALLPPTALPDLAVIRMNMPVILMSLALTVLTAFVCGLAPAFHILRGDLQPRLVGSGTGTTKSFRHGTLRSALVIAEVALSIVLLIASGLFMRSFFILTRVDLGFDPRNVLYFELSLPKRYNTDYSDSLVRKNALTSQLLERFRTLPGVAFVSEQNNMPPLESEPSDTIIPGKPHQEPWKTNVEECSAGYFQLLHLPLLRGRLLSDDDVAAARRVVVVNEAFVSQYFPQQDVLGRKVKFDLFDRPYLAAPRDAYFEIIGVVRDFKTRQPNSLSWQAAPSAFMPYSVANYSWRSFMLRTAVDPQSILKTVVQEVQALDPGVLVYKPDTLEHAVNEFYRGPQFQFVTLTCFASIGLVLVLVGIFSVIAYTVSLRTNEIGIRMALGARYSNILSLVLFEGFRLVALGTLLGLSISYTTTRFFASLISGVSVTDRWTFAVVALLAISSGLLACYIPARRAAQVDPITALRYE
jgi:putative ABC transport system permease protein